MHRLRRKARDRPAADGRGPVAGGDPGEDEPGARRARLLARGAGGRDRRADGPVGLGQVHAAARRQRAEPGGAGQCLGERRQGDGGGDRRGCGDAPAAEAPSRRHGVPAFRPSALAHGSGECRAGAGAGRCSKARGAGADRGAARAGEPLAMGGPQGGGAVGRDAAARGPRPRLRHRCADPADGRALLRPRSADPDPASGRVAGGAGPAEADHSLRQSRSRRGRSRSAIASRSWRAGGSCRPARRKGDRERTEERLCGRVRAVHEPARRPCGRGT